MARVEDMSWNRNLIARDLYFLGEQSVPCSRDYVRRPSHTTLDTANDWFQRKETGGTNHDVAVSGRVDGLPAVKVFSVTSGSSGENLS